MSMLKFTTLNNVESTLSISTSINNRRQRRNNVAIFNVEFHNVDQRQNNVVNMTIFKKLKKPKKFLFELQKKDGSFD